MPAPLWRRLAAALYDLLLLAAMWMVVAMLDTLVAGVAGVPADPRLLRALLFLATWGFFAWFWTHGGQTLGMRAWRLQVRTVDGRSLGLLTASVRFAFAVIAWLPLGLGVLWCAIDRRRRGWHDVASATEVVLLPKGSR